MSSRSTSSSRLSALLLLSILAFQGCDSTIYYREGRPPHDQKVWISGKKLDSIMTDDTVRSSLIVTYRVDWEIDSGDFAKGAFRLAMVHDSQPYVRIDSLHPIWLPKTRSIPIAARQGVFFDTVTSPGTRTFWPNFKVILMEAIGGGNYLAVARDSILLQEVKP